MYNDTVNKLIVRYMVTIMLGKRTKTDSTTVYNALYCARPDHAALVLDYILEAENQDSNYFNTLTCKQAIADFDAYMQAAGYTL